VPVYEGVVPHRRIAGRFGRARCFVVRSGACQLIAGHARRMDIPIMQPAREPAVLYHAGNVNTDVRTGSLSDWPSRVAF
jgi:hypothetical protein